MNLAALNAVRLTYIMRDFHAVLSLLPGYFWAFRFHFSSGNGNAKSVDANGEQGSFNIGSLVLDFEQI